MLLVTSTRLLPEVACLVSVAAAHYLLTGFSMVGTGSRQLLLSGAGPFAGWAVAWVVAWVGWLAGRGGVPWQTPCSCG